MTVQPAAALRVGIVGAGGIFEPHAQAWRDLGAAAVVYSSDQTQYSRAERYGFGAVDDLPSLIDQVDVVDICTPTPSHPDLVLAAARAGRHVICEKPLALGSAEAQRLVEACADAEVGLFVAHVVRYFPEYVAAHAAVTDGLIGQVAVQRLNRSSARPAGGWYADSGQSGGIITDQMIHDIDFARWVCGEVVSVFAREVGDVDDPTDTIAAHCLLTHATGAISQCSGVWGHPGHAFQTSFQIAGSHGELHHDSTARRPLISDAASAGSVIPAMSFIESPYRTELAEFAAAITTGTPVRVTAQDAVAAIAIAEAACLSVVTGEACAVGSSR